MTAHGFRDSALWAAVAVCFATVALADGPPSGPAEPAGPEEVARRYAPAIWLAQEEPFYPMLPHPFAFDGIDNDLDGSFDLADPDEVNAFAYPELDTGEGRKCHSEALRAVFGRLLDIRHCVEREGRPDECLHLDSAKNIPSGCKNNVPLRDFHVCGRFLGAGELRCGPDPVVIYSDPAEPIQPSEAGAKSLGPGTSAIGGIQYWMYYPWDAEHINDGEHVTIFYDPKRGTEDPVDVKVVIGAGHLPNTSNNVLYASRDDHARTLAPRGLPRHLPFLIELGKHASAPDFNCNGQFDIGVDANDGPQGVWGSRDVAVLVNKKGINRFDPWMSVARDGSGFLVEESFFRGDAPNEWLRSCPEFTRGRAILDRLAGRTAGVEPTSGVGPPEYAQRRTAVSTHRYRLVSSALLAELYKSANSAAALATFLSADENRSALWGASVPAVDPAQIASCGSSADASGTPCTGLWPSHPRKLGGRRDVWTHGDFWDGRTKRFDNDFKRRLFKRYGLGVSYLVEGGNGRLGLVGRVAGGALRLVPESSLDLGVWFDSIHDPVQRRQGLRTSRPSDVSVTYNAFRTSYRGVYAGGAWHGKNYDVTRETLLGKDGGQTDVIRTYRSNLSLHAGFTVGWARGAARFALRAGGQGSLVRGKVRDGSAYRTTRPAGLHVALEIVYGFHNDTHPLQR
jgi:hypothetical protein